MTSGRSCAGAASRYRRLEMAANRVNPTHAILPERPAPMEMLPWKIYDEKGEIVQSVLPPNDK